MKRQTAIALVAAAVIGTTGGVVFSLNGTKPPDLSASPPSPSVVPSVAPSVTAPTSTQTSASATPTSATSAPTAPTAPNTSASPTPSPAASSKTVFGVGVAKDNTPLLYVAAKEIHDGDTVIPISGIKGLTVLSVDRLTDGYLVGTIGGSDDESVYLLLVDSTGQTRPLVRATYSYDINLAKDRIVAIEYVEKRAVVFSSEGKVIGRTDKALGNLRMADVGFVEDQVAVLSPDDDPNPTSILFDPETSKTTKITPPRISSVGISPGGSFMAGKHGKGCLAVASDSRAENSHEWRTCDWSSYGIQAQFSPDGTKVLAVPTLTDGFGPGELAVFGVREGGKKPVGDFKTPNRTTDAKWADNTHLWVTGARSADYTFDKGAWISKCDFDGRCETAATTDKGNVVLGGGVY